MYFFKNIFNERLLKSKTKNLSGIEIVQRAKVLALHGAKLRFIAGLT